MVPLPRSAVLRLQCCWSSRCQVSCCAAVAINCTSRDLPWMFLKEKWIRASDCINTVFNDQDLSCLSCIKSRAYTSWQTHFYCIRIRNWIAGILNSHGLRSGSSFLHDGQLRRQSNVLHQIKAVLKKHREVLWVEKRLCILTLHFLIFSPFSHVSLPSQIEFVTGTKKGTTTSAASTTTTTSSTTVGGKE